MNVFIFCQPSAAVAALICMAWENNNGVDKTNTKSTASCDTTTITNMTNTASSTSCTTPSTITATATTTTSTTTTPTTLAHTVDSRYLEFGYLEFCKTRSVYLHQIYILIAFSDHNFVLETFTSPNYPKCKLICTSGNLNL